jgi:hypothetical protein
MLAQQDGLASGVVTNASATIWVTLPLNDGKLKRAAQALVQTWASPCCVAFIDQVASSGGGQQKTKRSQGEIRFDSGSTDK